MPTSIYCPGGFLEELISRYGYIAIFILTFVEGESVLIAAGFLAYNGYLNTHAVALVSAAASYVGHGAFFLIALYRREPFLKLAKKVINVNLPKFESFMGKYGIASIFISQWLYGFRLLSAAILGLARMGTKKYFTFQLISCLIWAYICTFGGYFFGATLKNALGNIKKYEFHIALGIVVAGFIIWFIGYVRRRKRKN